MRMGINTKKYHVFAPMGRFQLELIYLYFSPSFHLTKGRTVENKDKLIPFPYFVLFVFRYFPFHMVNLPILMERELLCEIIRTKCEDLALIYKELI